MLVALLVFFVVGVGIYLFVRQYRSTVAPPVRSVFSAWRILVGVSYLIIAYGLFISGRPVLQGIAVLIIGVMSLYVAVEQPSLSPSSS